MPSVEQHVSRRRTRSSKQVEPKVKPNKQGGNGKGSKKGKTKGKVVIKIQPVEVIILSSHSDPFQDKENPFKKTVMSLLKIHLHIRTLLLGWVFLSKLTLTRKAK